MAKQVIPIRRYPNRRFYARSTSQYVSLQEIEAMVLAGDTVEIRDSQTDEDLTRSVLTRIILERSPEKIELFPSAMLHAILRSNEVMVDFLRDYFRHALTYLDYLQRHRTAAPMHWMKAWLDGLQRKPPADAPGEAEGRADALTEQVRKLEARIRQLESQIASVPGEVRTQENSVHPN